MSDDPVFDKALDFLLSPRHEGTSFVDDPSDPGGATKFGISLREVMAMGHLDGLDLDLNHDGHLDARDIAALSLQEAATFYRIYWWDKWGYGRIKEERIAIKAFDLAVNMGPSQAHRQIQSALRSAWFGITVDGVLGQGTINAINSAPPDALYAAFKSEAAGFYRSLVAVKPPLGKFLDGWLNRAYSNPGAAQ